MVSVTLALTGVHHLQADLESSTVDGPVAVWSTLIGRAPKLLRSHWSRALLVLLTPALSYAIKNQLVAFKDPY